MFLINMADKVVNEKYYKENCYRKIFFIQSLFFFFFSFEVSKVSSY